MRAEAESPVRPARKPRPPCSLSPIPSTVRMAASELAASETFCCIICHLAHCRPRRWDREAYGKRTACHPP